MIQRHQRLATTSHFIGDLVATLGAFFLAWFLRFETEYLKASFALEPDRPDFDRYLLLLPFILVVWPVVFYFHGLYQGRRGRSSFDESLTAGVAVLLATVLLSMAMTWYRLPGMERPDGSFEYFTYSRAFVALFVGLNLFLVITNRALVRAGLRRFRLKGHNIQRILVVGAGALGQEVTRKVQGHDELGIEVIGFLDDDPAKAEASYLGVPVIGTLDDLDAMLEDEDCAFDQIVIALPTEAHAKTLRILHTAGRECVEVKLVPDILQYATLKASVEDLDGTPVINLSQVPLHGWNSMIKRMMDIGIATASLVGLSPFLPLVAAAIWLEDKGPIFYRQERMGLDGKSFMILKFRSMRVDAEATTGPIWAVEGDPRRTRIGSFLRHWSLDELPQIWNVLRGDMSIIGPRPERPAFVREFKGQIPQYMLRHRVKSGITGWAQVHGWRGNTSVRERINHDLYYIRNWSLMLDLKILWMTLRHGLRHNAY